MNKLVVPIRVVSILAAAGMMYWFCIMPMRCAHAIRSAETSTKTAFEGGMADWMAVKIARRNLALLQSVNPKACPDVDYPLLLSANATLLSHKDEAVEHLDEALLLDHRPEVYFNRATALLAVGRIDEAVHDFAVAADFNPDLLAEIDGSLRDRVAAKVSEMQTARGRRQPPPR
jgi:tetratricopeptide (TPR) repeat protein